MLIDIVNYNNYRNTIRCIKSLKNIIDEKELIDFVVVDNNSSNNSVECLEKEFKNDVNVFLVQSKTNDGYSKGNNLGIQYCSKHNNYKYISIVNPDTYFDQNVFEKILPILENDDELSMASCSVIMNGKWDIYKQSWRIPSVSEFVLNRSLLSKKTTAPLVYKCYKGNIVQTEVIPGSFFVIKYDDFRQVGFFDENMFMYNEEIVLGKKLKSLGKKAVVDLGSYYYHNHKSISKSEAWYNYRYNFNKALHDYDISYKTREYVCKTYYDSKGLIALKLVNLGNYFMLYTKHLVSYFKSLSYEKK